jgi:DNA-binding NtrC family response regulator
MKILSSGTPHRERITLLAVSSNPDDRRSLNRILHRRHCEVRGAVSCHEAVRLIARQSPTVVACEQELPDGTWKDLVALVHRLNTPPPVIVMSRHADERLWAEVLNLGGYDLLAKPLEGDEVSRVVEMACRHGRACQPA